MNILPLGHNIVLVPSKVIDNVKSTGLSFPDGDYLETESAQVLAVGPKVVTIKAGELVAYPKGTVLTMEHEGFNYLVLKEKDVVARFSHE